MNGLCLPDSVSATDWYSSSEPLEMNEAEVEGEDEGGGGGGD